MASSEEQAKTDSNTSLKLAITMALLRSKLLQKPPPPPHLHHPSASPSSQSTSQKWKRKAKDRKQELLRLKEDLKQAEDNSQCDLFPQSASCVCYFFDKLGELNPNRFLDGSDRRFNDVLRRRFLRQVRLNERRRRRDSSTQRHCFSGCNSEDETEQLRASVDFLVELCESVCPDKVKEMNFAKWSHQAVDFILAALKNILPKGKNTELLEGIISSLIVRLVRIMCTTSQGDELHHCDTGAQFYVQHLIRKLGSEPYIGQRVILSVSERISVLAESLLFMDPFDDSFPSMHDCMYMMIQLIEFLVSEYLLSWSSSEVFDINSQEFVDALKDQSESTWNAQTVVADIRQIRLFEEWVASVLHGRKALELLESRNGLYVLYMDRVIGVLTKQTGQFSSLQKLNPEILAKLFS